MQNKRFTTKVLLVGTLLASPYLKASVLEHEITYPEKRLEIIKSKKLCDVKAVAQKLVSGENMHGRKFPVTHVTDRLANYDYYAVLNPGNVNIDNARGVVCQHIEENDCYVFWGNVVNKGYFAEKPVTRFECDTGPRYVLAPGIGDCKKVTKELIAEKLKKLEETKHNS